MAALDNIIGYLSPGWQLKRERARMQLAMIESLIPSSYDGASGLKRGLKTWAPSLFSPERELSFEREKLIARSRDLFRNDSMARSAISTTTTNVIGGGLILKSAPDRKLLNMSDDEAEAWEDTVEREFSLWCRPEHCDAEMSLSFYELQTLAFLSVLQSGDVFALLPYLSRPGSPYKLKVQLIEADRVVNKDFAPDDDNLSGGIRTDAYGAPIEYHILKGHPNGFYPNWSWQVVPAWGKQSARRNVVHLLRKERPGQRRGIPFLTPVIEPLRLLQRYSEAELLAALISGLFTVFVKSESGAPLSTMVSETTTTSTTAADEIKMGPGAIVDLLPGEDVTIANPARPNVGFDAFVTAVSRQVGAALELPFELLLKHFTASYSASRAALLEAWKFFRVRRQWAATKFCQPVYEEFLTEAILSGRISAPGFFDDPAIRAAYSKAQWIGPSQGQIDPVKETQASIMKIDAALSTRSIETAAIGGDWEANYRQLSREERMLREAGLKNTTDNNSGSAPVEDPPAQPQPMEE